MCRYLIDDEWLVDAFDEVINKGICSSFVEQQLIDLANVFEWREDRDAYFCGIEDEISEFSRIFFKDIKVLRGLKPFGLSLNSKHDRKAVSEIIPKIVECKDAHKINQAINLLIKHHYLMDWVFDSDYFSSIKNEINQTRKWKNSFIFHNVNSKNGKYLLQLTHEKIRYSDEYWSFWINIEIDTKYEEAHKFYERICMCINYRKDRLFWDDVTNEKIKEYMGKKYSLPQKGKTIGRNNSLDLCTRQKIILS